MSLTIFDDIYHEIRKRNTSGGFKAVPYSDEFIKYTAGYYGLSMELIKNIIQILINSHKIFSIEIIAEDKVRDIAHVEGYVVCDLVILRKLKSFYQSELIIQYENEFHKRLMVHQVVKEIFPLLRSLNNTDIGKVANLAIMLEELERFMEKHYEEFTEEWKAKRLAYEISLSNIDTQLERKVEKQKVAGRSSSPGELKDRRKKRVVDAPQYNEFIDKSKSYPLERIFQIYGIDFFLRVQLRNYKFDYLKELVETKKIKRKSDLLLLKNMLNAVLHNRNSDHNLAQYEDAIYELMQTVNHHLFVERDF
ncbi:MAG TPA: hypothetical protein PKJ69_09515 [Spirochaetota bacterium]|mgnify:CR=1 FL=1|nr:hypothetical protein [Spirochaetota bacterium]